MTQLTGISRGGHEYLMPSAMWPHCGMETVCCKVLRAYYVSLGAGLSLLIVFLSPQRISFYSSSHQSEHPICAFNISECPIRLADLRLIVLFSVLSFSAHHLLSNACLLINVHYLSVSFSPFIYPLIFSFFSLIDDSCFPCFSVWT